MAGLSQSNNSRRNDGAGRDPAPGGAEPAGPPTARSRPGGPVTARAVAGLLLMHLGFGGMLLSVLWDVFYKGRTLDLDAIGPFKLMGIAAGLALVAVGLAVAFYPSKKTGAARGAPEGRPAVRGGPVPAERERPVPAGRERQPAPGAPNPKGGQPGAVLQRRQQPEEYIPEALPVVDGIPVAPGSYVLEAVPLDPAPRPVAYRPSNRR